MNRLNNKSIVETLGSSDYVTAIKDNKVVRLKVEFLLNQYGGPSGTLAPADADPEPAVPSWYFGTGPGNYTNLGINTTADMVFLVWNGTAWSAVEIDLDLSTVEANVEAAVSAKAEADAIQLLRLHDPNLVFSGFVNTTTATPAHIANKAYIATESGTIFGIAGVLKGQIVVDDGTDFIIESLDVFNIEKAFLKGGKNVLKDGTFIDESSFTTSSSQDQYISATPTPSLIRINTPVGNKAIEFKPTTDTASFYYRVKKASYLTDEGGNIQNGDSFRVMCLFKAENYNENSNILLRPETSLGSGVYVSKKLSSDWQFIVSGPFIMPGEPALSTIRLYFTDLGVTSDLKIHLTAFTMINENNYRGSFSYNMEWLISYYSLKNWLSTYGETYLIKNELSQKISSNFGKNIITDPFFTKRLSDNIYEDWVVTDNVSIVSEPNNYSNNILKVTPTAATEQLILRIIPRSYQRGFGKIQLNDYVKGCVYVYCSHTIEGGVIGLKLSNPTTAGGYLGTISIVEGWQLLEHPALQVTDFTKNITVTIYAYKMNTLPEGFYFGLTGLTVSKQDVYTGADENIAAYIGRYAHTNNNFENIKFTSYGDSLTAGDQWQPYLVDAFRLIHTNRGIGGSQVRNNATALAFIDVSDGSFISNLARNGGITIDSALTVDATASDSTVTVSDGSLFTEGKDILISSLGGSLVYETKTIVTIVGNVITLNTALNNSYAITDDAMIEQFPDGSKLINTAMCLQERIDCIPDDTQLLTILAGANDVIYDDIGFITDEPAENTTFFAAYKLMLDRIMTKLPTARIIIIGLPFHGDNDSLTDLTGDYQKKRDASKDLAYAYGFPYIDLRSECGWNQNNKSLYLEGSVHFNSTGASRVAEVVFGHIKKYIFLTN